MNVLDRFYELNQYAKIIQDNRDKRDAEKFVLSEKKRIKKLLHVDSVFHQLTSNYNSTFFKDACGKGPPNKAGSHKPSKSAKKAARGDATPHHKTERRITCKDGKSRVVYVKAGVEYVKRRDKQGKMRYVRAA